MGREPSSMWDRPVTDAQLSQAYGEPLSEVALEIGEQHVIDDMELASQFLAECSDERLAAAGIGPISTPDLVRQLLLNKNANDAQLAAAAREFRARLLKHFDAVVVRRAEEVSHA